LLFCAPKGIKIGGVETKLQSVKKWHVFYATQQNATNLNISVSWGGTFFET